MKTTERITGNMTIREIIETIGGDNIGALSVCTQMFQKSKQINPDDILGGMSPFLNLDRLNMYGSQVWVLFNYVCGQDLSKLIALLYAQQWSVAGVTSEAIKTAAESARGEFDFDAIMSEVKRGFRTSTRMQHPLDFPVSD